MFVTETTTRTRKYTMSVDTALLTRADSAPALPSACGFVILSRRSMRPKTKAGLHALIIGVGKYPSRPNLTQPGSVMSAARFAQWLKNEYRHPHYDLHSLNVLLSPVDDQQAEDARAVAGQLDGAATRDGVEQFVPKWAAMFNKSSEDAALLYVAGHGCSMLPGGGYLLLEGFGSSGGLLAHALNLSALIDAMGTKRAETNFVFVDACRSPFEDQIAVGTTSGVTPLDVRAGAPRLRKMLKIFYGAAPDDRAWTLHKSEIFEHGTVFSKCLMRALRGEALDLDDDGQLGVLANRLVEKTARLVGETAASLSAEYRLSIRQAPEGVGSIADIAFHVPETVMVDLEVELDPADLAKVAEANLFKLKRPDQPKHDRELPLDSHPAHLQVSSGKYQLHVNNRPRPCEHFEPSTFTS